MQNTSPGPEGKGREGRRGKEGRGLEMDADTSELAHCLQGFILSDGGCLTEQATGCVQHPCQQGLRPRAHREKQGGLRCSIGGQTCLCHGLAGSCPLHPLLLTPKDSQPWAPAAALPAPRPLLYNTLLDALPASMGSSRIQNSTSA